jgi:acyl-CoA dehydrogenase
MDMPANDDFLFNQGQAKGLGKIQFHDYKAAYDLFDTPNIKIFKEQLAAFKNSLFAAPPSEFQQKDIDFLLTVGELFTLIVYGHLILENAKIYNIDVDLIDQIFDFMVRDFSKFALEIHNKPSSSEKQMEFCRTMMRKANFDETRYNKIWNEYAYAMKDQYEMNP